MIGEGTRVKYETLFYIYKGMNDISIKQDITGYLYTLHNSLSYHIVFSPQMENTLFSRDTALVDLKNAIVLKLHWLAIDKWIFSLSFVI